MRRARATPRVTPRVTPLGLLDALIVLSVIFVTIWSLHPQLLVSSTLITGGDTGSHLALPAYLRSTGDPFNLTPWYPGWFAGMPAYTYYFVLPDVVATFASYVINFAVAMKLATVLGSVLMPITAYAMGRLFRAPRPIPVALALATLPFLFDASFTIDGGNLFSTMAGEYPFSLSLALALLTIGLFARGTRTGRGYWIAALALSATLAAHVLPWLFAIGAVVVVVIFELLQRHGIGDPNEIIEVEGDYSRPLRFAVGAGVLSFGLSAWWLIPFATTQSLTDSLGYVNANVSSLRAIFTVLGWFNASGAAAGDRWVIVLAGVAIVVAFGVRDRLGMVLATLTIVALWAYVFDPQSAIWNERLIPFWFILIHLAAGWLVGYVAWRWIEHAPRRRRVRSLSVDAPASLASARVSDVAEGMFDGPGEGGHATFDSPAREPYAWRERDDVDRDADGGADGDAERDVERAPNARSRRYRTRAFQATMVVALLGLVSTVPGQIVPLANVLHLSTSGNQVSSWAEWNYSGYQGKAAWPEYHNLIATMSNVATRYGCGRAMWEYSASENRFGTPEALMLLPYWTNNCVDSMEGLLMESSPTTPYHFLDQAELSEAPSEPQVGLDYGTLNVSEGVHHLEMLGVKYYIAFSSQAIAEANADPDLRLVGITKKWPAPGVQWRIYLIGHSPMVQALTRLPNVVANVSSERTWLDANEKWWLTPSLQRVYVAESGPSTWPRATSVNDMSTSPRLGAVKVSRVRVGLASISFHVSRVGVPVLVKISYYPRWHATGATGPYRVSPNLMVVVPTQAAVSLHYTTTPALTLGNDITDLSVVALVVTLWVAWRRRRTRRQ